MPFSIRLPVTVQDFDELQAQAQWAYVSTATGRPVRIQPEVTQRFTIEPP